MACGGGEEEANRAIPECIAISIKKRVILSPNAASLRVTPEAASGGLLKGSELKTHPSPDFFIEGTSGFMLLLRWHMFWLLSHFTVSTEASNLLNPLTSSG